MKSSIKVIAIDFDHTIHDASRPIEGRRMGLPIEGTKEALTKLHRRYKIIIFTIWKPENHQTIKDYMVYYKLPYDEVTNVKPNALAYIDDRAITFTNWKDILKQL